MRESERNTDLSTEKTRGDYFLDEGFLHKVVNKVNNSDRENKGNCFDVEANNKDSIYLGRHYIRTNTKPQTYNKIPDVSLGFWYKYRRNFYKVSKLINQLDVDKAVVINGCYSTNKTTLQATMTPEVESGNEYPLYYSDLSDDVKAAIKHAIRKLKLPDLEPCSLTDMYMSNVNYDASAGFRYSSYLQLDTKGEAIRGKGNISFRFHCLLLLPNLLHY